MRIRFMFKAGKAMNVGKDGKTYYNVALVIDGMAGNVNCSKEVYDRVAVLKENQFAGAYDMRWERFYIESVTA